VSTRRFSHVATPEENAYIEGPAKQYSTGSCGMI